MESPKNDQVGVSETPNPGAEEQEVSSYLRTVQNAVQWRDQVGEKAGWKRFTNEFKGNWGFLQQQVSIPIIPVNLVYAYVKTEIARLYFRDPWITVNPKRMEDVGAAAIAEQIVNYTWGELKLKAQIKLALLEALLVGHSWIKVGYVAEFGTMESQPKQEGKKAGRPPKKVSEVDTNEYLKSENVFAYHVPYDQIVFDPSATFPATHNARWMAHRVVKPYRAVVESKIYEHTDELNPSNAIDDPNSLYEKPDVSQQAQAKDVRSVVLWEIYDLDNQKIVTVSPGCKKKLREIPLPDYLNGGFPFVQFSFNPVPGDVYPLSDISAHEGQIIELTKILSIEMNHLKRWNRQMIVAADFLVPEEESKFKDANDGAIIKSQASGALAEKIFIPPYAPLQSDVYGVWNQVYDVWKSVAGQTASDQGGQAKVQTRTLGELRMQLQGGKARSDEKVDVMEDSIEEVARKLLSIMQKKYDLPKIARIVGPKSIQKKMMQTLPQRPSAQPMQPQQPDLPGMPQTPQQPNPVASQSFESDFGFSWNRTDIMGEMDVDVLAGSTVPMDRESQLQILEKMTPVLQSAGVQPGSPAAKAFAREITRLAGLMSMEAVLDIADQQEAPPDPKTMETQQKVQAKQAESQIKIQTKQAESQIKLQGMQEKLQMHQMKNEMDLIRSKQKMEQETIKSVLEQFRPQPSTNGAQQNGTN